MEINLWIWTFVDQCNGEDRAVNKMQEMEMQSSISEAAAEDLKSVTNVAAKL